MKSCGRHEEHQYTQTPDTVCLLRTPSDLHVLNQARNVCVADRGYAIVTLNSDITTQLSSNEPIISSSSSRRFHGK
ncbi:hypothetical protein PoB_005432600 [Plakobranchus ocellatus]|uniref:Uncharacterized protein n=1 Tax=Plakobranchus ocellatus TaxID=259542 RepID=A0AAV4BXE0_9GAST|nr:hypothetical protein PoB_005432600 [Plakobranchus ocellatus]